MFAVLCIVLVLAPGAVLLSFPLHLAWALRPRKRAPIGNHVTLASIIVPVAGPEEDLARSLDALLRQRASVALEWIFCAEDRGDPAVPLVLRAIALAPECNARLVIAGPGPGLGKMRNLIAGVGAARGDVLVFVDSDVALTDDSFVQRIVADAAEPGVGLVTCVPAYRGGRSVPAAMLASMINHDLAGYFAILDTWTGLRSANGACMAMRAESLRAAGGLQPLRDQLLMDTVLARRVAAGGGRVRMHEYAAPVARQRVRWSEWWSQVMRWQTAMWHGLPRAQYAAFLWLRSGGIAAIVLVALAPRGAHGLAWLALSCYMVARVASAWALNARCIRNPAFAATLWLLPAAECANAVTALLAMGTRSVSWRGRRYRVLRSARAVEIAGSAGAVSDSKVATR